VEYSLRLVPLGGYVAFPDDDPEGKSAFPPDDPDLLKNRSIAERALVISAGVLANCVFAMAILTTQARPARRGRAGTGCGSCERLLRACMRAAGDKG